MTIRLNENGVITLFQGDTGTITINGLDDTKVYEVYFSFRNKSMELVGEELCVNANCQSSVELFLPASLTDKLTVPAKRSQETYYYGVKVSCIDEQGNTTEDTLLPAFGKQRTAIVYPKWVEGPM